MVAHWTLRFQMLKSCSARYRLASILARKEDYTGAAVMRLTVSMSKYS
jgi:hypothetical protein